MKIAILGATGLVGTATLKKALSQGHQVTVLVRIPSKISVQHKNLSVIQGDALDAKAVEKAVKGQDAVIQSLGYGGKGDGKPTTFTTDATKIIIDVYSEIN